MIRPTRTSCLYSNLGPLKRDTAIYPSFIFFGRSDSVYLSVCLALSICFFPSFYLSDHLSFYLSLYPSIYLSICLICLIVPECVARVSVSLWGSGALFARRCSTVRNRSQPFATVPNRSQPLATVRNRSQPFAKVRVRAVWPCLW